MRKLLIVCDEYAYSFRGDFYLSEFGAILVKRYLNVFDGVRFVVRTKYVNSVEELGKHNQKIYDKNIEVFPIPFFQGPIEYGKNYLRIKNRLKVVMDNCDAAIFRLPSTIAFACIDHAIKMKAPFGVEVVANPLELKQNSKYIIVKFLMSSWDFNLKRACRLANAVSYVTEKSLQNLYPSATKSFSTHYSSIEMDKSFFMQPRILNSKKIIRISHVSNQIKTYSKGHRTVINAVKILTDRGFDVIAKFAGEGKYVSLFMDEAKNLGIEKRIEFVGTLNKVELRNFLKDSNIMIFPSSSEGLSRVIIEAMATGLPCLSTPVGGIPELLDDQFLFDPNDAEGFANKTAEIFSDNELYFRISEQNYNKSLEYEKNILDKKRTELYIHLYNLADNR